MVGSEPADNETGWSVGAILAVAAWGAAGLALATRYFSWEPRR